MPFIRGTAVGSGEGLPPRDDLKGSTLRSIFGIELSSAAQFVIAGVVIFILLALFALVLRRLAGGRLRVKGQGAARARQPRLGVIDIYDLDQQRQLVLLRRDNVEHLIMIGGPNDVVVEASIVRGSRAGSVQVTTGNGEDRPPAPALGEPETAPPPPPVMPQAPVLPQASAPVPPSPMPQLATGAILAPAIIPDIGVPPAPRATRQQRPDTDTGVEPQLRAAPPPPRPMPVEPAAMDADLTRQIEEALQRSIVAPDFGPASGLVEPEGDTLAQPGRREERPQSDAPRPAERREPPLTAPPVQRQAPAPVQPQAPRSLATPVAPAILPPRAPAMPRGDAPVQRGEPAMPRVEAGATSADVPEPALTVI